MPPDSPASACLRRLAALAYDLLVLAGVLMATSFVVIIVRGGAAVPAGDPLYQLFLAAQVATYFIGFWRRGGQTPGMRAWRLRVQTTGGDAPSVAVAAGRFAAALLAAAPAGLGFFWMLVDAEGRTWHDRMSGTHVVRLGASRGGAAPSAGSPGAREQEDAGRGQ